MRSEVIPPLAHIPSDTDKAVAQPAGSCQLIVSPSTEQSSACDPQMSSQMSDQARSKVSLHTSQPRRKYKIFKSALINVENNHAFRAVFALFCSYMRKYVSVQKKAAKKKKKSLTLQTVSESMLDLSYKFQMGFENRKPGESSIKKRKNQIYALEKLQFRLAPMTHLLYIENFMNRWDSYVRGGQKLLYTVYTEQERSCYIRTRTLVQRANYAQIFSFCLQGHSSGMSVTQEELMFNLFYLNTRLLFKMKSVNTPQQAKNFVEQSYNPQQPFERIFSKYLAMQFSDNPTRLVLNRQIGMFLHPILGLQYQAQVPKRFDNRFLFEKYAQIQTTSAKALNKLKQLLCQ